MPALRRPNCDQLWASQSLWPRNWLQVGRKLVPTWSQVGRGCARRGSGPCLALPTCSHLRPNLATVWGTQFLDANWSQVGGGSAWLGSGPCLAPLDQLATYLRPTLGPQGLTCPNFLSQLGRKLVASWPRERLWWGVATRSQVGRGSAWQRSGRCPSFSCNISFGDVSEGVRSFSAGLAQVGLASESDHRPVSSAHSAWPLDSIRPSPARGS